MKRFYKLFVIRVSILDKADNVWINKLETFANINMHTDKGDFTFIFKSDRRDRRDGQSNPIMTYIVELDLPNSITIKDPAITDSFVAVVKVVLFKPNPEILAQLLMDLYVDAFVKRKL